MKNFKQGLSKRERKQHKQARSMRQCSRGKQWQEMSEQSIQAGSNGKCKQWERIA